jgi:hypothetical protein
MRGTGYWNIEFIFSFTSIANQKSVRYSVSISYFTNTAVQNVNKAFVYIMMEFTASLTKKMPS